MVPKKAEIKRLILSAGTSKKNIAGAQRHTVTGGKSGSQNCECLRVLLKRHLEPNSLPLRKAVNEPPVVCR